MNGTNGRVVRRSAVTAVMSLLLTASGGAQAGSRPSDHPTIRPSDWPSPARDLAGTRFTPLNQLTPLNVSRLRVLWSFGTGSLEGHEGNPLVIGSRLYLHTPHPVAVYAFDLEQPGAPPLWKYGGTSPDPAPAVCCGLGNRGIAWHPSGKLYVPLFPGDLAAIDEKTGREIWRVRNGDPRAGLTMPAAPLDVGNVVIVGVAGGEFGARGYLSGYDAMTGQLLWSVTPRVETIEPAHTIMMKMKNINHTLLNVAMDFASSASCSDGAGTSCGTCAPLKNTQRARQAGRIMNIKPTASNKYPAVFSIFQAFSCGFMNENLGFFRQIN